jgi:hypothetical protein
MRWSHAPFAVLVFGLSASGSPDTACCYFSALDKDVKQPGQKAFLTWDPVEKIESFTVQPMFEGNAVDFGMVVPTPSRPKLQEAHRDFFKMLAVFTILKPMNAAKFKGWMRFRGAMAPAAGGLDFLAMGAAERKVTVLESGVVGSLDYKILEAKEAQALYDWLKQNDYAYAGDKETLEHYVKKGWFFTVMKIDPKQMKKEGDSYRGEVTPTRFTFASDELIYPLKITQISVRDRTDALFYIQAPDKMDFPERFSYQLSFQTMWTQAFQWADWDLCTKTEADWWAHVKDRREKLAKDLADWQTKNPGRVLSTLEWSRRLTPDDFAVLTGQREFDREAPAADVEKLASLAGILREGQFITKCRHVFLRDEMDRDLVFEKARWHGKADVVEHIEILPTSPP